MVGKYVVVRTQTSGVHVGFLAEQVKGREVKLLLARRIWSWKGAFTLSEVSQKGISEGSKLSCIVPEILLTEASEIIPTSKEAEDIIRYFKVYEC